MQLFWSNLFSSLRKPGICISCLNTFTSLISRFISIWSKHVCIIYAWMGHRWMVNRWIVYHELEQPQKHGEQTVLQSYLYTWWGWRSQRGDHFLKFFRWNIVLHDSYQTDKTVTEFEERKQKVPGIWVKSFSRVLLSMLETICFMSCILSKLYYMNLKFDYS